MTARSVVIPTEHGGWSLTLEPVVLGLLAAPSSSGFLIGLAAFGAFLVRTPLKVVLVDRVRGRLLDRTKRAAAAVAVESVLIIAAVAAAVVLAEEPWWWPVVVAAPLVAVATWFDARSRSRRLLPELAGSIGIGSVAAMIALAGGATGSVAAGLWVVIAARVVAAIPFVRVQLRRAKHQDHRVAHSDGSQIAALAVGAIGWAFDIVPAVAVAALAALVVYHLIVVRLPPMTAPMLGAQQVVAGLAVVLVAGLGVRAP